MGIDSVTASFREELSAKAGALLLESVLEQRTKQNFEQLYKGNSHGLTEIAAAARPRGL